MTTALEGDEGSASRPGRFYPGNDPVSIAQEAGWATGPSWTCAENLVPTGIRTPDRPARSQSLYRLSYPAHENRHNQSKTQHRVQRKHTNVRNEKFRNNKRATILMKNRMTIPRVTLTINNAPTIPAKDSIMMCI